MFVVVRVANMPNDDTKLKTVLSDLGKSTNRGVRKCPKCGTYNGIRGLCCKNKACNVVFKEVREKTKLSIEACKLNTGTTTQIYSVRVRGRGPDYRGFVQLPVVQQLAKTHSSLDNDNLITQTSAVCFVDTCQRSFNADVLKCHEKSDTVTLAPCQHIQAALRCFTEASPLTLKNTVLSTLNISNDIKEAVWLLANESAGPLVQRISKNIMAVKCKASPKHPLGYLHVSFFLSRMVEKKYLCSCTSLKGEVKNASDIGDPSFKKCVHFYACVCAFASDPELLEEFAYYINMVIPAPLTSLDDQNRQLDTTLTSTDIPCGVEVEVLQNDVSILDTSGISVTEEALSEIHGLAVLPSDPIEVQIHNIDSMDGFTFSESNLIDDIAKPLEVVAVKRKCEDQPTLQTLVEQSAHAVEGYVNSLQSSSNVNATVVVGHTNSSVKKRDKMMSTNLHATKQQQAEVDETTASFSFTQWLASVTERINQTMHFQFSGKPGPLVFHVPQVFFDCLRERISCGGKKKRLPNSTKVFARKDSPPLGTFTKYTWNITNIIQLKQIFDTPLMPLEITRSFIDNGDGTFEPHQHKTDETETSRKIHNQPLIKPPELKTFLKVGNTTPDQSEPTPFVIEWIPNVLPESKIGELKIKFEYGHLRNGHVEKCKQPKRTARLQQINDENFITRIESSSIMDI